MPPSKDEKKTHPKYASPLLERMKIPNTNFARAARAAAEEALVKPPTQPVYSNAELEKKKEEIRRAVEGKIRLASFFPSKRNKKPLLNRPNYSLTQRANKNKSKTPSPSPSPSALCWWCSRRSKNPKGGYKSRRKTRRLNKL